MNMHVIDICAQQLNSMPDSVTLTRYTATSTLIELSGICNILISLYCTLAPALLHSSIQRIQACVARLVYVLHLL